MLRDLFSLFPAYAGVIPTARLAGRPQETFPRIRGGDPRLIVRLCMATGLFPAYAGVIHVDELESYLEACFSPHTRG